MASHPFAGFNPRPSPWGYNWTTDNISSTDYRGSPPSRDSGAQSSPVPNNCSSPEPQMLVNQYVNMPAALLNSLKREKKPFTYTPGGVNLSEVLNARLQKRLERKKKYTEQYMNEKSSYPVENLPKFESPKQLIVMSTYNSPLDMYSMDNALEALEVQAELAAADKSFSGPSRSATLPRNHRFDEKDYELNRGVAQSKAFKVLQIITDTEEEPPSKSKGGKAHHEETRFTGIRESKAIPSKFFHTLQKITGTEDDESQNESPREMEHVEPPKAAYFDKQQATRQGFQPQSKPYSAVPSPPQNAGSPNHVTQFQPMSNKVILPQDTQQTSSPALKRPAAFFPMNTGSDPLSRVKPVHPAFLANGSRKDFNPSAGTDF